MPFWDGMENRLGKWVVLLGLRLEWIIRRDGWEGDMWRRYMIWERYRTVYDSGVDLVRDGIYDWGI